MPDEETNEEEQPDPTDEIRKELAADDDLGDDKEEDTEEEETKEEPEADKPDDSQTISPVDIDDLIERVLGEREEKAKVDKEEAEQRASVEEALRLAEEDGDYTEIGRLAAEQARQAQAREALRPAVQAEERAVFDSAVTTTFGDAIGKLSEEDKKSLNRSNFASDVEFVTAVLGKLREIDRGLAKAEMGAALKEAEEAARNSDTGRKARADGQQMLGGGAADESAGSTESIGDMIRRGLEGAFDETDDSD